MTRPLIIGVAGGSGSGKTTLARELVSEFQKKGMSSKILRQDSYYIDQSDKFDRDGGAVNFDHPDSLEFSLLAKHLKMLEAGESIEVPIYDFPTHSRSKTCEKFEPVDIVVVDGILIFSQEDVLAEMDFTIFVEASEDNRFQRRLARDVKERGRTEQGVRDQFFGQVKPMHDEFVEPSRLKADACISNDMDVDDFMKSIKDLPDDLIQMFKRKN